MPGAGTGHGRARGGLRAHRHPRLGGNRRGLLPEPGDRALQPQDRVRAGAPASRLAFQAALARGRVRLDWQAVRHAGHPEWEPLYRETLLRVTAASGEPPLPTQELILALERLGLIRLLDRCVLGTVLDRLNAEPTLRLACNLSRQSAAMDAWWEAVCRWLAARPQVARRLTLELTETAVGERVATREFIRRLREHGVRIAIDDFGAAHNNLDFVLDARPDVIKIDCRYTREARRSAKGAEVLRHLLALCRELAPCVVLEGLEEDDAFARLPTGDVYLQGNAIAPPMRVEPPLSVRRPKSRARIEWRTLLLSGDASPMVASVAAELGIDEARGGLTPDDKLAMLERLHGEGRRVLMLGDGVNDVPVLAGADISVAMGSATDLAKTSADAVLLSNRLDSLVQAFRLARRTRHIIIENLAWASLYNGLVLPFAALGWITPGWAAIGMSVSSLLVVVNALRLTRIPSPRSVWPRSTS
ncbi:diguanylate phosphodiesterase (plasmid) [Pseudomonas aeruginosa VRFPA03]|nr:diguanylate phosphodiesterase [Pseudomonas aeruginosa VRFPA03]